MTISKAPWTSAVHAPKVCAILPEIPTQSQPCSGLNDTELSDHTSTHARTPTHTLVRPYFEPKVPGLALAHTSANVMNSTLSTPRLEPSAPFGCTIRPHFLANSVQTLHQKFKPKRISKRKRKEKKKRPNVGHATQSAPRTSAFPSFCRLKMEKCGGEQFSNAAARCTHLHQICPIFR